MTKNVHLGSTQTLLKLMPKDDPDFAKIQEETKDQMVQLFIDAVDQEKAWADYLFKDGSMIGLNATTTRRICRMDCQQAYDGGWTRKPIQRR